MSPKTLTAIAFAALLVGAAAEAAHATAPGRNGPIAFRRYLGPDRTHGAIFTIAPDGSAERQVTNPPAGESDDFPDFASDSRLIAFQRCGDFCHVYTVRPDGTRPREVGDGCAPGQAPPRCDDNFQPAISPNGKEIAFSRASGRIVDDIIDQVAIYRMRLDGSHRRRVTLPPRRAAEDSQVQWSPDGKRLVFVRHNITAKPAGKGAVFVVNADGTRLRRITPWEMSAGDGPDWSPDGSRILFRAPETDDFLNSDMYTIRANGTGLKRLTHVPPGTKLYSSSFSPDGTSITFGLTGTGGAADVFRMLADGSAITPITRSSAWDSAPDWGGLG
jgi:Tol biopolymer transport system component